jgi:hypothetical protein
VKEVVYVITVAIIFIKAAMERSNPPFLIAVVGEKEGTKSPITKKIGMDPLVSGPFHSLLPRPGNQTRAARHRINHQTVTALTTLSTVEPATAIAGRRPA